MSSISTVIIITSDAICTDANICSLNRWIQHNTDAQVFFTPVAGDTSAGNKYPQRKLFWGGFKSLNENDFIAFFKSLSWDGTLLIIGSEESDVGYQIVVGNHKYPEGNVLHLDVPYLESLHGLSMLNVNQYAKVNHPQQDSDSYFETLDKEDYV